MARAPSLEACLKRLAEIRRSLLSSGESADALAEVRDFLTSKHSHAVATAATIVAEQEWRDLTPELLVAFERLMKTAVKRDPGCKGKAAIADALHELGAYEGELFETGIAHRQMEPVWGGRRDTAGELRTACGRGLVRMRHPDALLHLAELLADPELGVRLAAAQSLAYHGSDHGLPVLRLKVLSGDPETEVIAECLLAMMRISPESSLAFVARFLDASDDAMAESAALALGESRASTALEVLLGWRKQAAERGLGAVALLAVAMLRSEEALESLLELVASEPGPSAREAVAAFEILRHDEQLRSRVEAAAARNETDLRDAVEEAFER